jgi:hypothetical protein
MEGAVQLDVPLLVNISYGSRWGSMAQALPETQLASGAVQ